MNTKNTEEVKKILDQFTPQQQGFMHHLAETQIQNKLLTKQISDLKAAYDELYKIMIVLLHADKDHELRIHESHFLRFKEEYRIDRSFDEKKEEVILRLKTLRDIEDISEDV